MINLLQSNVCGRASRSEPENNDTNNNAKKSSFLSQNLQQNGNLNSEKFDETMKIDDISSGDQIAFIKIQDDLLASPSPIKPAHKFQRQTQFQRFFMQFYPDFFRQYCSCMHRKVQPDDLITVHSFHNHHSSDDHYGDKYAANRNFLLSPSSIIPITVVPQKYEYVISYAQCFTLSPEKIVELIIIKWLNRNEYKSTHCCSSFLRSNSVSRFRFGGESKNTLSFLGTLELCGFDSANCSLGQCTQNDVHVYEC